MFAGRAPGQKKEGVSKIPGQSEVAGGKATHFPLVSARTVIPIHFCCRKYNGLLTSTLTTRGRRRATSPLSGLNKSNLSNKRGRFDKA